MIASDCTISGNGRSAELSSTDATLTLDKCTVSGNTTNRYGAGVYVKRGTLNAINSTFSDNTTVNTALGGGAAIAARYGGNVNLSNSTFANNTSAKDGGHFLLIEAASLSITNSLMTGGSAVMNGTEIYSSGSTMTATNNLWGDNSKTTAEALVGVAAGASDLLATSDGAQSALIADIIQPAADNGGKGLTHLLSQDSFALDAGDNSNCGAGLLIDVDQRGEPREDGKCDIGAVEIKQPNAESFYVIPNKNGKTTIFSL